MQPLAASSPRMQQGGFDRFVETLTVCFPLWVRAETPGARSLPAATAGSHAGAQVCLGATVGIARPQTLAWFKPDMFTLSLGAALRGHAACAAAAPCISSGDALRLPQASSCSAWASP